MAPLSSLLAHAQWHLEDFSAKVHVGFFDFDFEYCTHNALNFGMIDTHLSTLTQSETVLLRDAIASKLHSVIDAVQICDVEIA